MSATYSADQIVGKNLIANKAVNILRLPNDAAKPVYTVPAGSTVGVVVSYLKPAADRNRSTLYWMFYDQNNKPYYVKHQIDLFDVKNLKEQGTLTVKDQTDQNKEKDFHYYISEYAPKILIGVAVIYLAAKYGTAYINKKA